MNSSKIKYSSKDIARLLLVEPVTVRKYSQMLEERGYEFERDKKGWRVYTEQDLKAFKYITTRPEIFTLEKVMDDIANMYHSNLSISPSDITLQVDENPLLIFMKSQQEFNQKILERLEAQEKRQAERDQNLLIALRESQEVKKQIASAQEKKWWKFWR